MKQQIKTEDNMDMKEANEICQKFANDHKLIFETEGEVGFGRECVGFLTRNGNYLAFNPHNSETYEPIAELQCDAVTPPEGVKNYHKHDCMAVLGRGNEAIAQLAKWVEKINSVGNVRVVRFETGATGMQVLFSGVDSYCIMAGVPKNSEGVQS